MPDTAPANRLGIVARDLTVEERGQIGVERGGVLIESVKEGLAAHQAGLSADDVILMLDQHPVEDLAGLDRILGALEPGRSVATLVQRGDGKMFYAIRVPKS